MHDADDPIASRFTLARRGGGAALALVLLLQLLLAWYWDDEPAMFDVRDTRSAAVGTTRTDVTGHATVATLIAVARTLLDKPGGYLSNDVAPPGVIMDNVPSWEFGVLTQTRDLAKALRNDFSRSQTQSTEDPDLTVAEPQFNVDSDSWILPSAESEYAKGIEALERYRVRLTDDNLEDAQFYARADNLREWLTIVEKRLGSLSQRLSASVGQVRVNTDLGGDAQARQAKPVAAESTITTPWMEIDDVFWEARGATWALIHFLKAIEVDCESVLEKKNALVSLRQIIRELESTQDYVWSPMILNGTGFGFVANHSLVMASYVSRANAAVIDLRNLLEQG